MVNYSTYRGGVAYGVPLKIKSYSKTQGSGMRNINHIGGAEEIKENKKEVLDMPSKPRGRPPKQEKKQVVEEEAEDADEYEDIEPKKRGRKSYTPTFTSNLSEQLTSALGSLRMEEHYLRSNKDLPGDIRAHEIKENRKLQKDLSKIFLKMEKIY